LVDDSQGSQPVAPPAEAAPIQVQQDAQPAETASPSLWCVGCAALFAGSPAKRPLKAQLRRPAGLYCTYGNSYIRISIC